jgi:hypothetical protein
MTGADGTASPILPRLITTLMDHRRFPAAAVVRLNYEGWEIECPYFALRHTLLDGNVLRSGYPGDPCGPWEEENGQAQACPRHTQAQEGQPVLAMITTTEVSTV